MDVSGEAVRAAQKAYRECEGDSTESHRAALTAALPFLSVQGAPHTNASEPVEYDRAEAMRILSLCACKSCSGTGERNDADVGDISFNTWECADCGGKGWNRQAYFENFPRRSALEPSAARELALEEAARVVKRRINLVPSNTKAFRAYQEACRHILSDLRILSSPDHAGVFPQSKNEGRLSELNVEPGEVFERISGHDRHSDNLIGAKYISKDTGPYCQGGLHLERIPSGTGWTTMDDRGIFRRLSCDAGKVEGDGWLPIESAPKDGTVILAVHPHGQVDFFHWQSRGPHIGWRDSFITVYPDEAGPKIWMPIPPLPSVPSEGAE